jgi:hypothetical protein
MRDRGAAEQVHAILSMGHVAAMVHMRLPAVFVVLAEADLALAEPCVARRREYPIVVSDPMEAAEVAEGVEG